jgi:uncharacterized protein
MLPVTKALFYKGRNNVPVSKKKVQQKRNKKQTNSTLYMIICAVIFLIIFGLVAYAWLSTSNRPVQPQNNTTTSGGTWSIDSSGKLSFSPRGPITADSDAMVENTSNYTLENISYSSLGGEVYALLRIPKNVTNPPVVIIDPALTMTKEMDEPTAEALCGMGYATLTLDQRGLGQTGGNYYINNYSLGFSEFVNNETPVQYEQIYDILRGLDYVKTRPDLDGNDTAVLGESVGSVFAIDAAGIEPQFKGVITISGFDPGYSGTDNAQANEFMYALMPSKYLPDLPPRELAMFQFDNDSIISLSMSKALYNEAQDPKAFYLYNGTTHGMWNDVLAQNMSIALKSILGP